MKRGIAFSLVLIMLLTMIPMASFAVTFDDTVAHWAEGPINRLSDEGVINGYGTYFDPDGETKRSESAQIFMKLFGYTGTADLGRYTDMQTPAWYDPAIEACVAAGVMNGTSDITMSPNGVSTRETIFVMFGRAIGIEPADSLDPGKEFADSDQLSSWSRGIVYALINADYVKGMDGKIAPGTNINRASLVSLIDQTVVERITGNGTYTINGDGVVIVIAQDVTIKGSGDVTIVVTQPNTNISLKGATGDVTVAAQADNIDVSDAPVGTTIKAAEGVTGTTANGDAVAEDSEVTIKEETTGSSGGSSGESTGGSRPSTPSTPVVPEHEHNYADAWTSDTAMHWQACTMSACTATTNKAVHSFYDGSFDCTAENGCSTCGYVIHNGEHTWGDATVSQAATCTQDGISVQKCTMTSCTGISTSAIAAQGHSFEWTYNDAAGTGSAVCSGCGETTSASYTVKIGTEENSGEYFATIYDAIDNAASGDTITLLTDITVDSQITVNESLTFDGKGKTITAADGWTGTSDSDKHLFDVVGGDVTVENVTFNSINKAAGVQAYKGDTATSMTLTDVTIMNSLGAGLIVNGAEVNTKGLTTTGNAWGGVNVDKQGAKFTLTGTNNIQEVNQIWSELNDVTVVNAEGFHAYQITDAAYNWSTQPITALTSYSALIESEPFVMLSSQEVEGNLTIPDGKTLKLAEDVTLTVTGDVTGKIVDHTGAELIYSKTQLEAFRDAVNGGDNYAGKTVKLVRDIDLQGSENNLWIPIGHGSSIVEGATVANKFNGIFDGDGHTISNLIVNNAAYAALFGNAWSESLIQNVTLENVTINTNHYAAGVVAHTYGDVKNCVVSGASITCVPDGTEGNYDNGDKVGGVAGWAAGGVIDNCDVTNAVLTGFRDIGGILGASVSDNTYSIAKNCYVDATTLIQSNKNAYTPATTTTVDFICGRYEPAMTGDALPEGTSGNSYNHDNCERVFAPGTVDELKSLFEAAANGSNGDITIEITKNFDAGNNWEVFSPKNYSGVNNVTINGNGNTISNLNKPLMMGSFAGSGSVTINDLTISGASISGVGYNGLGLGAFVAYSDASGKLVLNNCHLVNSEVTCTGEFAGGLVGYSSSNIDFKNCSVSGSTITSAKSVGALIGQDAAAGKMDSCSVTNCTMSATGNDGQYAGIYVGTANAAASVYTNMSAAGNNITALYGRAFDGLSINGTEYVQ